MVALLVTKASRVLESRERAVVGGVDGEVVEPEKSGTLALEDVGDPAEGVVEVPEGDANAGFSLGAAADGLRNCQHDSYRVLSFGEEEVLSYIAVVLLLPLKVGLVQGELDSDVELGQSDLNAGLTVRVDDGDVVVKAGRASGDSVRLHTDTIDSDTILLQHPHDVDGSTALRTNPLEIVVVVVKLRIWVRLGRLTESNLDVLLAEDLVEDGLAPGAVVLEGLVDDIPGVAATLPVTGDGVDVADDGLGEGLRSPFNFFNPRGELRVPDEGVAAEDLVLLFSNLGDDLAFGPVEDALLGLGEQPLFLR